MTSNRQPALKAQITRLVFWVILISFFVGGAIFVGAQWRFEKSDLEHTITIDAKIVAARSTAALLYNDKRTAQEILVALKSEEEVELACVYALDNSVLATYGAVAETCPAMPPTQGLAYRRSELHVVADSVEAGEKAGTVYMRATLKYVRQKILQTILVLAAIFALTGIAGAYIARRLLSSLVEPLEKLTSVAAQIGKEGSYQMPATPQGSQEMVTLWQAFSDLMLEISAKQERLVQREENLSITLNSIGDAVIVTDRNAAIVRMNPVAEQLTGWQFAEAQGKSLDEVLPLVDELTHASIVNPVRKVLASNAVVAMSNNTTLVGRGGQRYQIADSAAPIKNAAGDTMGVIMVFHDVSEQYRMRRAMDESQRRWQALLDNMPSVAYGKDHHGKYLFISKQYTELLHITPEQALGKSDFDLFPRELAEQFWANDARALASSTPIYAEETAMLDDGPHQYLSVKFRVQPEGGGEYAVYGISTDISVEKAHEAQLQRAQKMDALGKLTGGISHDINNLLGIILGYAELLQRQGVDSAKQHNAVNEILRASERGKQLTGKLLAFSRKRASKAVATDINQMLRMEKQMLEKSLTPRVEVTLDLADSLWLAWIDAGELEDAVINMSINAQHAMQNGGCLTLRTRNESLDAGIALQIGVPVGEYVSLCVADTGSGMDEQTQRRIFEPFFSTKGEQGTGLGLSQVYGFVSRSGGGIAVQSEVGAGTRMTLYFPRHIESTMVTTSPRQVDAQPAAGGEAILVVDDEPALRELCMETLSLQGYRVLGAQNAEEALAILGAAPIDLLLSDIILPGMDGYQLASIVKDRYPNIKIQLASGFSDDRRSDAIDLTLHDQRLEKPYRLDDLLQRVRKLLDG